MYPRGSTKLVGLYQTQGTYADGRAGCADLVEETCFPSEESIPSIYINMSHEFHISSGAE